MTRVELHRQGVAWVARRLRKQGLDVEILHPRSAGTDITCRGLSIAVRVARWRSFDKLITVNGTAYRYHYDGCLWNRHAHNKMPTTPPDVYALVIWSRAPRVMFVPYREVPGGPTIQLVRSTKRRRGGVQKMLRWENRFDVFQSVTDESAA